MSVDVSVLMAMRDARATLDECLKSIGAQTLPRFNIVVVDDGSLDGSADYVRERLSSWSRGEFTLLGCHREGLVPALNCGLACVTTPLVARMDADDRMRANRLLRQSEYLNAHREIDLVAGKVCPWPSVGIGMTEYLRWQDSCMTTAEMRDSIYVESPFVQPTVMFRTAVVSAAGGYRDGAFPEDYELWLRLNHAGSDFGKVDEVVLDWRQSEQSYSKRDPRFSRTAFDELRAAYLARHAPLCSGRRLAIWGAGRRTRRRVEHLLQYGYTLSVWIDIDPNKIGNRLAGVPVVAPDWLTQHHAEAPFVLGYVASHGAREAMAVTLQSFGYKRGDDYLMVG